MELNEQKSSPLLFVKGKTLIEVAVSGLVGIGDCGCKG